jgi:23S rRNA (cytosine1962-C5)-methyltransferase
MRKGPPSRHPARRPARENDAPPAGQQAPQPRLAVGRQSTRQGKPGGPPALTIHEAAARAARRGHPWVFRDGLSGPIEALAPGDLAELRTPDGAFVARAMIDPASPIAARVISLDEAEHVDDGLAMRRLDAAIAMRKSLMAGQETDAFRLCNGEGDGLPGLVVDRYGDWAVLRPDGAAAAAWASRLRMPLFSRLTREGIRGVALRERGEGVDLGWAGEALPDTLVVTEHGQRMEVDLARGQKTGAFLDQRENRRRVRLLAPGRRALNLFSYAGGFSLAAALGGASEITSVDIASGGHASAQRSLRENGLDPSARRFVTSDVFVFLEAAARRGERWDLIVSDPPSFAPSEKAKPKALAAYRKLHTACLAVLAPGGIHCAASCSSHVTADDFVSTLEVPDTPDRADEPGGGRGLRLCELHGQPADHPSTPAWREGRYLKFAVLFRGSAG